MLLPLALAAGWFLLALANGIGWALKGGPIDRIVRVEALDYGVGFSVSLLLALVYSRIQKRLSAWLSASDMRPSRTARSQSRTSCGSRRSTS